MVIVICIMQYNIGKCLTGWVYI